jgi:hypothetical protein
MQSPEHNKWLQLGIESTENQRFDDPLGQKDSSGHLVTSAL